MARFGDGLACGPDLEHAAESAVTQALTPLDGPPDLMCVFVCGDDPDEVARAGRRAMALGGPGTTIGCSGDGVIGASRGIELTGAVSAFAARLPGVRRRPFHLETVRAGDRLTVTGMPRPESDDAVAILLADPYSFPVDAFVESSTAALEGLPLVGGIAGGTAVRMFLQGEVVTDGAVGVLLGGPLAVGAAVSQGCRPVGPTMVVTKAEGNVIHELAGMPALDRLQRVLAGLPPAERRLAAGGLQIGVALDERAERQERGDFLVRGIVGADPRCGSLTVGDVVEVGQTIRLQVRDAAGAEQDLYRVLDAFTATGAVGGVEGALLFSCNGRGSALFPSADHDVAAVRRQFGPAPVGGFFAAGEIGPVAGRNHVHGYTASILVFGTGPPSHT